MNGLFLQATLHRIAGGTRTFSALCARTRFPGQAAQRSDAALCDGFADLVVSDGFTNTNVHNILSFFELERYANNILTENYYQYCLFNCSSFADFF